MELRRGSAKLERESVWRQRVQEWHKSGLSQAEYCRKHGLNANTLSSWKYVVYPEGQKKRRVANSGNQPGGSRAAKEAEAARGRTEVEAPRFVKAEIAEDESDMGSEIGELPAVAKISPSFEREEPSGGASIIAELSSNQTGIKLKLFKGVDQATLATLLAAWSTVAS